MRSSLPVTAPPSEPARGPTDELSYGHVLRALGHFLDSERALRARIVQDDTYLTLSWLGPSGRWEHYAYLRDDGIRALLRPAAGGRRAEASTPPDGWEERLRTVGQDLDAHHVALVEVVDIGGIEVRGRLRDAVVRRLYSGDELRRHSAEHRRRREKGSIDAIGTLALWCRRLLPL